MILRLSKYISYFLLLIFVLSLARHFNGFNIPTWIVWFFYFITYFLVVIFAIKYSHIKKDDLFFFKIYFIVVVFGIVRGVFSAENYWHNKMLILNSFKLLVPLLALLFSNIFFTKYFFTKYVRYIIPMFLLFVFFVDRRIWGFFLIPISILLLTIPYLKNKKIKILIVSLSFASISADFEARSVVIKFLLAFFLLFFLYYPRFLNFKYLLRFYKFLFILPIIFVVLGLTGRFNLFNFKDYLNLDLVVESTTYSEGTKKSDLLVDTRTFIYAEVLNSALKNNYVLFGRTPARGNDSNFVQTIEEYEDMNLKERFANEVSILNIFTWLGLVGVFSYSFIFFKASYLSIMRSNNSLVKVFGIFIAIRWLYSWIEEINDFDASYVSIFIMLGLCYSTSFRELTDYQIKKFLNQKK
jgi:hypothetical protein